MSGRRKESWDTHSRQLGSRFKNSPSSPIDFQQCFGLEWFYWVSQVFAQTGAVVCTLQTWFCWRWLSLGNSQPLLTPRIPAPWNISLCSHLFQAVNGCNILFKLGFLMFFDQTHAGENIIGSFPLLKHQPQQMYILICPFYLSSCCNHQRTTEKKSQTS